MKRNLRPFLIHSLWGTILALFLIGMFHFLAVDENSTLRGIRNVYLPLWVIFMINIIFQSLLWLDQRLDGWIPWYDNPRKRLLTEIAIAFPTSLVVLSFNYIMMFKVSGHSSSSAMMTHQRFFYVYIIMMMVLGVAVCIVIARNFFRNWRESMLEVEKLKEAKMKSDYQALQDQLNPHFLFNNFNMLISEIRRDPANAVTITEKLADVYRYVLESNGCETVTLGEEIQFSQAIIFLYQARFGDNLKIQLNVSDALLEYRVPPLTIQILIENALKHNVVSSTHPLQITIRDHNLFLEVSNNIHLRKSTYSTGLGLKNIHMRYAYLTQSQVTIEKDDSEFKVMVPLLERREKGEAR